ncbi:MFS transporter [Nocardiopsis sp. CC223A]|uniref:MFS transporter n=1 Tax=Nocardiopsis sp. CC223A TaxID=3044051 RepID=UPI0027960B40|nr:MFS transporter [Nocardiopsis sp. CC223A]
MGYLRLLRQGRVAALWAAQLLAVVGGRLYALAVMWLVWQATGSAFLMGLVAVLESIPYILVGAFGRRLTGRLATWGRLALVQLAYAAVVASVPPAWALLDTWARVAATQQAADVTAHLRVALLLVVALLVGTASSLLEPLLPALAPSLVDGDRVRPLMGLLDLAGRLARILGPGAAGALLLVVNEVGFYGATAVGFLVSALVIAGLGRAPAHRERTRDGPGHACGPLPADHPAPPPPPTLRSRLPPQPLHPGATAAGWRILVRSHPSVAVAVVLNGAGQLAGTASAVGLPILLSTVHEEGLGVYGALTALAAVGAVAGNLTVGNLRPRGPWLPVFCAAWAVAGLLLAAMGLSPTVGVLAVVMVLSGAATPWASVTLQVSIADRFPMAERVAVLSAHHMVVRLCGTAGMLVVPLLVDADPPTGLALTGLALVAAALAAGVLGRRIPETAPEG